MQVYFYFFIILNFFQVRRIRKQKKLAETFDFEDDENEKLNKVGCLFLDFKQFFLRIEKQVFVQSYNIILLTWSLVSLEAKRTEKKYSRVERVISLSVMLLLLSRLIVCVFRRYPGIWNNNIRWKWSWWWWCLFLFNGFDPPPMSQPL